MARKYDKYYFEAYAALTLSYFDIPLGQIAFRDRPDLQCDHLNIGIEVTQSISEYVGKLHSFFNDYLSQGYTGEKIKEELRRHGMPHAAVTSVNGSLCISPYGGPFDFSSYFINLNKHIAIKIHKLNNGYKKFSQNGLYLFMDTGMIAFDELNYFFWAHKEQYQSGYDIYYINCIDKIFYFDCKTQTLKEQSVKEEDLFAFNIKALALSAENINTKR